MKLKKILAGVLASAMTLTAGFVPEIVNETKPLFQPAITASAAEYSDIGDFFENAVTESEECEFFDGTDEEHYMLMKGRKYYQGIKMIGYVILNVENVEKLSFDICKIDGTGYHNTKLYAEAGEKKLLELTVNSDDSWKHVNLDVSKVNSVKLYIDQYFDDMKFGLGDFTVDDMPVAMPHTVPQYNSINDFIEAADPVECELYDGTDEEHFMCMKGRKYYQGVKVIEDVTFNVENVKKLSFDLCRIDGSFPYNLIMKVYRNGEEWQDIKADAYDTWHNITFDVSKIDTISFKPEQYFDEIIYGMGDITIDDLTVDMTYTSPEYENEKEFINSYTDANINVFDGSNTFNNFVMSGKEYYQGMQFDGGEKYAEFNVENVDSITFTLGTPDTSSEGEIWLKIYNDGELWYELKQSASVASKQYKIDLTNTKLIKFQTEGYMNCGMMNIVINDDCTSFTDGTYDFTEEVYTDPDRINLICMHSYENGVCTICGFKCEHEFENGICKNCKLKCTHQYEEGVCTECGHECTHAYEKGVCIYCMMKCRHVFEDGKCKICETECKHSSYKCGICQDCGYKCEHEEYVNGKCTVCRMPVRGDISGNGKVDLYDAIEIAKFLIGKRTLDEEESITADYNKDGSVDLYDAIAVAKYMITGK